MRKPHKNNWFAKLMRSLASPLPVAKNRRGACHDCGECCKLPKPCFFLGTRKDGKSYCKVHRFKPLVCRRYPQMSHHHVTREVCGYWFEDEHGNKIDPTEKSGNPSITISPTLLKRIARMKI